MLSRSSILGLAAMALLAFGCGKSSDNGSTQATAAGANEAGAAHDAPSQDAKAVVTSFLEAIRRGDNDAATKLLTKVARQKAEGTGRCVAPPANDSAKIEVEEVVFPTPGRDIAHVPTKWIDLDATGKPRTDRATWVCRLEPEGWRVAGFAAYVFDGEDPLLLSFEDPDDMAKKQKWLIEEMSRREKEATTPPASGENSFQAEKKPQDAFRR
jgi:ketosteroid isomerase-like protein